MPLEVLDTGTTGGTTSDALDDGRGSCGGNGPDRVYAFTLTQPMRSDFDVGGYDTVLHLRSTCNDQNSEIGCDDDGGQSPGSHLGPVVLDPGTYYLWVDSYSAGGTYTLNYSFRADPCANDEAVCPGTPVCQASSDWSSYQCVCPPGYLPFQGDCIDDPCDPNPCAEPHKTKCVPDLPGSFHCACDVGYIDDPQNPGTCIMDPNANEWTFMVYVNADNNLNDAGLADISEMETAGSTPYVNIVVLVDTSYGNFCGGASGSACKIYVKQGSHQVVENMGEIDMGDWHTLRDFGIWAVQNYPARHYALVMWDHGSGWDKAKTHRPFKGLSWDDSSGNHISVAAGDYEQALAGITAALGAKLDLVGHDECLMGMWEVAAATAPYARYFVASEETEPFEGWAYDGFLPQLVADPLNTNALQLGQNIADAYYDAGSDDSTMAVIDLETMDQLNSAMAAFADALSAHGDLNSQIDSVRSSTQSFYYSEHRDLMNFAQRIVSMSGAPSDLVQAAQALVDQLSVTIAYNRAQSNYPGANGMAVYLPSRSSSPDGSYMQGVWCQLVPGWCQWLQGFNR
ncbi:MAG: hypothetical protein D6806_01000 [Deltaproteobacteria bacterium]|nr:MAG: hypothetical protein D6806_01000 [Deltaproteobacteria bacterium]